MSEPEPLTANYLLFRLGDELYALPATSVREIARHQPITPVPGTPPALPGIISRHGAVLPVVDPRPLLGLAQSEPTRASRLLSAVAGEVELALIADSVADLVALPGKAFAPPPPTLDPNRARMLGGVASHDEQPLALLDLTALVAVVREGS